MGTYTELILKVQFKKEWLSTQELEIFEYLFTRDCDDSRPRPLSLPDHPFFAFPRWDWIRSSSSFYHHPRPVISYCHEVCDKIYLFMRIDCKNYNEQIEKFLDCIVPLTSETYNRCIGWRWVDELEEPVILYYDDIVKQSVAG